MAHIHRGRPSPSIPHATWEVTHCHKQEVTGDFRGCNNDNFAPARSVKFRAFLFSGKKIAFHWKWIVWHGGQNIMAKLTISLTNGQHSRAKKFTRRVSEPKLR